jgi:long-chain acyl-CoA synthetase
MEHPWLVPYPTDVSPCIDVCSMDSPVVMATGACRGHTHRPAFTHLGITLTYAEFERLAGPFRSALQATLGPCKGERITLILPNCLQVPVVLFGSWRTGMVVVIVNPPYTAGEVAFQLQAGAVECVA